MDETVPSPEERRLLPHLMNETTPPSPAAGDLRPPLRSRRYSKEFLLQPDENDEWLSVPKPSPMPAPELRQSSPAHVPFKLTLMPPPLHMPASLETTLKLEAAQKREAGLRRFTVEEAEEEAEVAASQKLEVRQAIDLTLTPDPLTPTLTLALTLTANPNPNPKQSQPYPGTLTPPNPGDRSPGGAAAARVAAGRPPQASDLAW